MNRTTAHPLLTIPEAAAYLNVSVPTMWRLRRDGVVPVVKLGDKTKSRVRVRREDLDALIAAGYQPATSGPLAR